MENILVTGGAGFIGTHIVELLVKKGYNVSILDNLSSGSQNINFLKNLDIELHIGDIRSDNDVSKSTKGIDIVIHLAAMNRAPRSIEDPISSNEINITGTLRLLEQARKQDLKFIFSSSSSVFGAIDTQPRVEESFEFAPLHPYGLGKLASEFYTRQYRDLYGLDTTIARFFSVYGPRQSPTVSYAGVIPKFINNLINNKPLIIEGGQQSRNFIFVKDIAMATFILATNKNKNFIYNLGGDKSLKIKKLIELLFQVAGKEVEVQYSNYRIGDIMNSIPDTSNMKNEFNFNCNYSFKDGLKITYEWFENNLKYFQDAEMMR